MSDAVVVPPRPAGAAAGESLLGRHICVSRVGYTHHGILSSATGETVVHYAKGSGALDGVIREESFARFLGASPLTAVAYVEDDAGRPAKFTREEIVARARHCIGLADYGLFGSNCEHWARWVEIDESYSKQIHAHGKLLTSVGIFAGIVSFVGIVAGTLLMRQSGYRRPA